MSQLIESLINSEKMPALNEADIHNTSIVLENQETECERLISEGTASGDVQQFIPIFMPLARRVMPQLIANELMGVQHLTMPQGYIFSVAFRYTGANSVGARPDTNSCIIQVTAEEAGKLEVGKTLKFDNTKNAPILYVEGDKVLVGTTGLTEQSTIATGDENGEADVPQKVLAVYSSEIAFQKVFKNYTGSHATAVGEQLATDMKEIGFSIERKSVEAKTRKLKAKYTIEMYHDLKSIHGLNADDELMNMMAQEVEQEINREVIDYINALATVTPDFNINNIPGRDEIEKFAHISARIDQESLEIARWCRRGAGNVIIASAKVVSMLKALNGYKPIETNANIKITANPAIVGTLDGRKIILDMFAKDDYITILYKGSSRVDAPAFYAPYVPVSFTRVTHQESGQPAIILLSRYGIVSNPISPETYVRTFKVNFTGVNTLANH